MVSQAVVRNSGLPIPHFRESLSQLTDSQLAVVQHLVNRRALVVRQMACAAGDMVAASRSGNVAAFRSARASAALLRSESEGLAMAIEVAVAAFRRGSR